jgi:hypothetical protein
MDAKEKSYIETNISITMSGQNVIKRVKFKNKKGTFQRREQCKTCAFTGLAIVGLGNVYDVTCDREGDTWKSCSGSTDKPCKFHKEAE